MDYKKLILRIKCPEIRECPFREPMSCTKCRDAVGEDSVFAIKELLSQVEELEAKNKRLEQARENANAACAKWEYRAKKVEEDRDRLREAMIPNCIMCDSMHENGNCTEVGGFCTAVPAAHCPLIPKLMDRVKKLSEDLVQERLRAEANCAKWEGLYRAELEKKGTWVSVKDRLPEDYQRVLCLFESGTMEVSFRASVKGFCYEGFKQTGKVTHWIPLPEPPKEE